MNLSPKTIQIYLPTGEPQGIRIAEVTTRIVQTIEVPRSLLKEFNEMDESAQVAFYFLFGSGDEAEPLVYIGQSGDVRTRMARHNKEKDFWERALVVISRTNSLTQTHAAFLEWYSLQQAREAGRYKDTNGNDCSKPHTPPPLRADCLEIFDTAKTLLATLGYPLFDPVAGKEQQEEATELFLCAGSGADGRGLYTSEGFVVLEGSYGRLDSVPSLEGQSFGRLREDLINSGVLRPSGDRLEFQKDYLFRSPSGAAAVLMGRSANGWIEWKNVEGHTLDEVKRQPVEDEDSEQG